MEWLIALAIIGALIGAGAGYALGRRSGDGGGRSRELERELDEARRQHEAYRQEVAAQFSETARKFQTLNDSYTDLHQQLARSSSLLCGDASGPLLKGPAEHQTLIREDLEDSASEPGDAGEASAAAAADGKEGKEEDARRENGHAP
ncbi:MAG: YhcB family protein [Pseudomonadota bacterium]